MPNVMRIVRGAKIVAVLGAGLLIAACAVNKPTDQGQTGMTSAATPGSQHDFVFKVGDRVLFGKWSGTEIKIDGEDFVVAKESDIMGVVEEAASQKAA